MANRTRDKLRAVTAERDALLAQLMTFWRAEKRPWFCRACVPVVSNWSIRKGYLLPLGKWDFTCADCGAEYNLNPATLQHAVPYYKELHR